MVRQHAYGQRPLGSCKLCELFNLTPVGLDQILAGADWKPEHEAPAVNFI